MQNNVSPTTVHDSTHHLKLTDSSATEVGLICVDSRGNRIPRVAVNPYPNFASQLRQGRGKHADRVPPFEDIAQSDFSGGLASLHFDEDASKYLDGKRIDTSRPGEVIHGGLETYTTGLRDFDESWPGNVDWTSLYSGGTESVVTSFVAGASYDVNSIVVILKKVGAPTGNITVSLLASNDAVLKSKVLVVGTNLLTDLISERVEFTFASVQTITAPTTYKVKVAYASGSASAYVDVAVDGSDALYYRVLDDTTAFEFVTFEYKNAVYGYTKFDDGSVSKLYIAGDRGAADANTGALTTTIDATKSWTTNGWAGDVVLITGGDGLLEEQPWRTIVSNNGTTLTHATWTITHDTNTEYVILSDAWLLKQTLSAKVHGHTVVADKVYFGFGYPGGTTAVSGGDTDLFTRRYREYNSGGTWTEEISQEDNNHFGAERILGIASSDTAGHEVTRADMYLGAVTPSGTFVSRFQSPYTSEDMAATIGTIVPNNRAWSDTIYANATPNPYYYGSVVNVDAAFTTGKCARWSLSTPLDIRGGEAMLLHMNINPAGVAQGNYDAAGDIRLILADSEGNEDEYNLNGTIEEWYDELIFLLDPGVANADMSDITDLYWHIENDEGQVNINVWGSILLMGDRGLQYHRWDSFESGEIINNMIEYAGGAGQVVKKPWILTDRSWYYIEDGILKEIYLKELEEFRHYKSGLGAVVHDVYLYANAGKTIQRYYAGKLDNVGPDAEYGLPQARRGYPISMASYPGRMLSCIDAETSGTSSVIFRKNHGWHEAYRAWGNERIRNIHIYARADSVDRMYISEGADVLWVPISHNPLTESGYEYTYESVLESSQIYGGLRETEKYYHAITLVTENLDTTNRYIQVDYRTSEDSTWAAISGNFTTSPRQRRDIVSTNDTTGRWIQFRIRSYTNDRTETPKLISVIVDSLERLDVNNTFSYTIGLKAGKDVDRRGADDDQSGVDILAQLETWVDDPKPLTLNTASKFEDGKLVFLEGMTKRTRYKKADSILNETRIVTLTLIEVS